MTEIGSGASLVMSGSSYKYLGRTLGNAGTVTLTGTGGLYAQGGGAVNNSAGATFDIQSDADLISSAPATFTNAGVLRKSGGSGVTSIESNWTFHNTGTVQVQSGTLGFYGPFTQAAGTTIVNDGTTLGTSLGLSIQGGVLQGPGTISGSVSNAGGTVKPGGSPGILTITGSYSQGVGGILETEIGGLTPGSEYDRLAVSGSAALGGTLDIRLLDPFVPVEGNAFTVMTYASRTGLFGTVTGRHLGGGLDFGLQYLPRGLTLLAAVPLPGDTDWDGDVDFADYQMLESNFGSADPVTWEHGDFDDDGDVDFADYGALEANFGTGIPEPACACLLAFGALGLIARRRH